jgi:hypothetical protein
MMADTEERVYSCDSCGEETDDPVSIHLPVAGKNRSPIDLCPCCAAEEMQRLVDRLGHEHGSSMLLEIKSRLAKKGMVKAKAEGSDDSEE